MIRCATCTREAPEWAVQHFTGSCPWCLASVRPLKRYREVMVEPEIVPPSVKVKGVPAELDSIILKCLSHNPEDRYSSVAEMARDLRNWKKGEAVEAHSNGIAYRGWKFAMRKKAAIAAATAAVLMIAFAVSAVVERGRDADEAQRWVDVGDGRLEANDDRGAYDALSRAIALRPTVKAHLLRGFASWRLLDYAAAVSDADAAYAMEPGEEIRRFRADAVARIR
jgi:hypothetical protein